MKIAVLTSVYGEHAIGGAERSTAGMVGNLIARGHQVTVISLGPPPGNEPLPGQAPGASGNVHIPLMQIYDPYGLDGAKPQANRSALSRAAWHALDLYNPWMVNRVKRQLALVKPDVLFSHALQGFSAGVWGAAKELNIKIVHMIHDHALICPGTAMTRGTVACETPCQSCEVFSKVRRAVSASPDAIIGPSQMILDRHSRFGWFRDVPLQVVVGNALPADWPVALVAGDRPGPANPRPWVFGFLGRLDASKGADTLVQAASRFGPDQCTVKLAGGGDSSALLAHYSGSPEALEFCGVVKAAPFLAGIDVLVTVSRAHETFCNVVMEAASLGVPAIVSDRGTLPERVMHGEGGWVIPAGDANALADAMAHCMQNPQEVALKARFALESRGLYSQQTQTDKIEQLLIQVSTEKAAGEP